MRVGFNDFVCLNCGLLFVICLCLLCVCDCVCLCVCLNVLGCNVCVRYCVMMYVVLCGMLCVL